MSITARTGTKAEEIPYADHCSALRKVRLIHYPDCLVDSERASLLTARTGLRFAKPGDTFDTNRLIDYGVKT